MAFQTGTQVNAALGRTDFTPFLQGAMQGAQAQARGAELIGQGLANLGQQVATGVEKYYKKQEEKQLNEQAIDTVSRILKTNPAFGDQIGLKPDASGNIDRKAIGSVIKSLGGAPNTIQLVNTLNEFTRRQTEDTQAAQYAAAATEAQGRPFSMLKPVSPTAQARGAEMAAKLANLKSETARNLAAAQPKTNEAPAGYRFDPQGNLVAIPGGPAAVATAAQAEAAKREERALKLKEAEAAAKGVSTEAEKAAKEASIENMRKDAEISAQATLQEIGKAKTGVNKFLAQGFGSGISGFFSGSPANDLEASYTVIGANQALKQIMDLKRNSPTGTTGLGALNLKELEVLQSRFAKLTTSSSDKFALEALNDLEKVIRTAFPNLVKEEDSSKQTKSPQKSPPKSRFEVVSVID